VLKISAETSHIQYIDHAVIAKHCQWLDARHQPDQQVTQQHQSEASNE